MKLNKHHSSCSGSLFIGSGANSQKCAYRGVTAALGSGGAGNTPVPLTHKAQQMNASKDIHCVSIYICGDTESLPGYVLLLHNEVQFCNIMNAMQRCRFCIRLP